MKKVLVPIDFSDTSLNALHYALALFSDSPLELTLLHTYRPSSRAFHMISIDKVLEDDARVEMDALTDKLGKDYKDVSIHTKIVKSDALTTISSLGNSGKYDFIVMGTKGSTGLKEVFIGSVAGGVIAKTLAPVLVVPTEAKYQSLEKVTFAISDSPFSDNVVKPLRELVEMSNCSINVLHVAEEKNPTLEEILSPIKDLDPSITYAFGEGNVNEQLESHLEKGDTQLLCLIRSKRGFFGRLFGGSVTRKQTFNSPVPLLVLHG